MALFLVLTVLLLSAASGAQSTPEFEPPLLAGRELPLPLDALIANTPEGFVPFPAAPFPESPFWRAHSLDSLLTRKEGPPPKSWLPWPFQGPPPGPHPRPPPGPPPPGAVELALKLLGAVGLGLEAFYANKTSSNIGASGLLSAKSDTCGFCAGNETQKLLEAVEESVTDLCSSPSTEDLDLAGGQGSGDETHKPIMKFCEIYPKLRLVTVLALLSKMKLNPLSLAITRCAAAGPCAFPPHTPSSMENLELFTSNSAAGIVEDAVKFVENVSPNMEASSDLKMDMGVNKDTEDVCQECIVSGFELVREVVGAKFGWVCKNAQCPRIKAMCNFTSQYPYLTMVAVVLKLKPWRKVVPGCFFVGACKGPPHPGPSPHPQPPTMVDVQPLPIFPHLDLDPYAPPPPPPPSPAMCFMGFLRGLFGLGDLGERVHPDLGLANLATE